MERAQTEEAPVGWDREAWCPQGVPYPADPLRENETGPDEFREKVRAAGTLAGAASLIPGPHRLPAGIAGLGLTLLAGTPDHRRAYTMSDAYGLWRREAIAGVLRTHPNWGYPRSRRGR